MLGLPGDFDWSPCNVVVVDVVINVSVGVGCGLEFCFVDFFGCDVMWTIRGVDRWV